MQYKLYDSYVDSSITRPELVKLLESVFDNLKLGRYLTRITPS